MSHLISLQRLCRTKKLYIYVASVMALLSWSAWYSRNRHLDEPTTADPNDFHQKLKDVHKRWVIENKGSGCVMPKLDPFDKEAMEYEKGLNTGVCKGKDWVECYMDKCFVTHKILEEFNVSCIYRDIVFKDSLRYLLGPPKELRGDQKYSLKLSDHVQVSCHGVPLRHELVSPAPLNIEEPKSNIVFLQPGIEDKAGHPSWSGHKTGLRRVATRRSSRGPRLNILILCFGSMSKNGFMRTMPESYQALQKMQAMVLNGYNIVDDSTSGAVLPILTGNQREIRKSFSKDFIDEDSFIFSRLSKMGYRTAFFEDTPVLGTIKGTFSGFEKQPTDHYFLPFLLKQRGTNSRKNHEFCIGETPLYGLLLNLTHQFSQLSGNRFSFTFISSVGREDFNMRSPADQDMVYFLRRVQLDETLEDTVLFVMGDHGPSLTPFRETHQGKFEERLPLMAIVVPERLKQTRPEDVAALAANVDLLTTPYDVHTTLTDLMLIGFRRNRFKEPGADVERGLSLLQPAGVLPHWCACAPWHPLDTQDPMRKTIGHIVTEYLNGLTHELRLDCAVRKLVSVKEVLLLAPNNKLLKYKAKFAEHQYFGKIGAMKPITKTYRATVVMSPGRAVFEMTLNYFVKRDYFIIADENISRITPALFLLDHTSLRKDAISRAQTVTVFI